MLLQLDKAAGGLMADDDKPVNGSLRRLRIATGVVLATLTSVIVLADAFAGSFGIRGTYEAEPLILGTLLGGLLLVIGIEIGNRWPFGGGK